MPITDVHQIIASLQQRRARLDLDTTDLCFLVALRVHADLKGAASFPEETLFDIFEQVCDLTDPAAGNPRKRATHAIGRLREQRLLGRVDGAGLVRAGEYALTRLAAAVVEFFLEDEALTRESLSILTKALLSHLSEIKAAARSATDKDSWREVAARLRVTVRDLVDGIERRQRGLDAQQQEVRERISGLLGRDWFGAVDQCEGLLDDTACTLRELHEVLMHDSTLLQALLQEIGQLAVEAEAAEAEAAVQHVSDQVDRVGAWGASRQAAWSEYYQYVHRYLRSVVRLDPGRAVSTRLQEQIAAWPEQPFFLVAAEVEPTWVLRETDTRPVRPPVVRPTGSRDVDLQVLPLDDGECPLPQRVEGAVRAGAVRLSEVLREVLPAVAPEQHFVTAGRVCEYAVGMGAVRKDWERPWVEVDERLMVEEWSLRPAHRRQEQP